MDAPYKIHIGDCLDTLRAMPDNSVDSIVTDPPYGLSFMGKKWDYDVPAVEVWDECLRVLKPGGHLLAFAGTRTQHRMAVRIEDAGFEIRDMIAWVYSSGFPKSMNLDRLKGEKICGCEGASGAQAERDVRLVRGEHVSATELACEERGQVLQQGVQEQGSPTEGRGQLPAAEVRGRQSSMEGRRHATQAPGELCLSEVHSRAGVCAFDGPQGRVHHGASLGDGVLDRPYPAAQGSGASHRSQPTEQRPLESGALAGQPEPQAMGAWSVCGGCGLPRVPAGLGTALKPALEPITVARKPLDGTVAANVLAHGTGALNIDGCRVPTGGEIINPSVRDTSSCGDGWNRPWMQDKGKDAARQEKAYSAMQSIGRWPANMILSYSEDEFELRAEVTAEQKKELLKFLYENT